MDLFTNPMSLKMLVPEETVQSLSDRGQDMKVSFLDAGVHGGQRASGLVNDPSIASLPSCPAGLARLAGASRVVQETDGSHETFMQGLAHRDEHQEHEEGGRGATGKDSEGGVEDASTGREHKKNCHFCQHVKVKKGRSMVACETPGCTLRFCVHCLNTQFTQEVEEVWRMNVNGKWSCPLCKQICCCTKIPRLCDELHRHCKAYRYRDKRAQEQSRRCKDSFPIVLGYL
ncbi:hypothetical protein GUITHDRAFT_148264 [Guillardia theta CCMP2712]|uniref:Zinc-finger domain-containing protein n=1 Tax=Guillardia theta (strain CCMP2712) TaxID=905079 RepID=L1IAS8_GUITC|nr:hypothetical protein GUITHDRAFT_148264 [Guillardia theta CCMP2712]EKX32950.1 hypothetical protein GUITHDRAFT_148264 [Guillardia theta CCMP2712]|eukprot:XP_005819930.1 hypothetical protein GUITHDRAFT_148264 [Guillardia theta CCMP2712]